MDTTVNLSSSLGTVTGFKGVSLDLAITRVECTSSRLFIILRYEHCPYPFSLASEKLCNSTDLTSPKFLGL